MNCTSDDCETAPMLFNDSRSLSSETDAHLSYQVGSVDGEIMWEQVTVGDFGIGYQAMVSALAVNNEQLGTGNFTGLLGLACELIVLVQIERLLTVSSARELDHHQDDSRYHWLITRRRDVSGQPVRRWSLRSDQPVLLPVIGPARRLEDILDVWHRRGGPRLVPRAMRAAVPANSATAQAWPNWISPLARSTRRHKIHDLRRRQDGERPYHAVDHTGPHADGCEQLHAACCA